MLMAEAWCAQQTWQVKLLHVQFRATKLLTPLPQLHVADAPMRMARVAVRRKFYELTSENWSLQPGSMRRRMIPERLAGDNMVIFLFGGAISEEQEVTENDADAPSGSWKPRLNIVASTEQSTSSRRGNGGSNSSSKTLQMRSLPTSSETQNS